MNIFCSGGCGASITVRAEDASSIAYTCARCAPQDKKADAPNVSREVRKTIPEEVLKKIERSLATAPDNTPPITRVAVEVETSGGTKKVKLHENDSDDTVVDDIIEREENEKRRSTQKRKRVVAPPPSDKKPHNPFGPQSLPHPGVFNPSNKEAPYGYDDEGRPIRVIKTNRVDTMFRGCVAVPPAPTPEEAERRRKRELEQEEERAKREQELAAKREREWKEKLERLTHLREFADMKGLPAEESRLSGSGWGTERRFVTRPPEFPATVSEEELDLIRLRLEESYRDGLTRQQLVKLLNAHIGEEIIPYLDKTKPKTKTLLPRAPVEAQVRGLARHISEMKVEIGKLDDQISEQKRIRHGLKKTVMKRERDPDNIPSDADLRKFRSDIDGKIDGFIIEQGVLKDKISAAKKEVKELQERLDTWETRPENYIERYPTATYKLPICFSDVFVAPRENDFKGRVPRGYSYYKDACGAYCQLVYELGEHKDAETTFKHWRRFEEAVVAQFYAYSKDKKLVREEEGQEAYGNEDIDHSAEANVIKKTSGAAIRGSIRGGGTTWAGKPRSLSSFDRSISFGGGSEGGGGGGDVHTEAQGSDDDEPMTPD